MHLKLNSFEKDLVQEISTLSGYSPAIVREVLEFTFIRQIEQYFADNKLPVPFLGELLVKFKGDEFVNGEKDAIIDTTFLPSSILKTVVGEIEDGDMELIKNLLEQKVKAALSETINK